MAEEEKCVSDPSQIYRWLDDVKAELKARLDAIGKDIVDIKARLDKLEAP